MVKMAMGDQNQVGIVRAALGLDLFRVFGIFKPGVNVNDIGSSLVFERDTESCVAQPLDLGVGS